MPGMPGNPAQGKEAGWEMSPDQEKADRGSMRLALNAQVAPKSGEDEIAGMIGGEPTQPQKNRQLIEQIRDIDQRRSIKKYAPGQPMKPGSPILNQSTGKWGTGI